MFYNGIITLNDPSLKEFPVRGIDVSSWQGEIDWPVISENMSFAFIKATEGSTFRDEKFQYNFSEANKTNLAVGAYHFLSFESGGDTQAQNFINTVPINENSLPPVIDIEFYGKYNLDPMQKEKVKPILDELIDRLEKYYGKKPIIYASYKTYDLYIKNGYDEKPIWIRDTIKRPVLSDGRKWTFWQYGDRHVMKGYSGKERFIDVNVFNGSVNEFYKLF